MRRGHGQLYHEKFLPIAQIGDVVAIRQTQGFVVEENPTPFYQVSEVLATPRAGGPKGILGVYSATAGVLAPYTLDTACQANINTGVPFPGQGGAIALTPNAFTLVARQFAQMRFLIKAIPDGNGAYVNAIDDFDFQVTSPPATPRWGTQYMTGVANAMSQGFDLADYVQEPTNGNNIAAVSGSSRDPMDYAGRTETFIYGAQTKGTITVINNGVNAAAGAIGFAIGLFVFNLVPMPAVNVTPQWFLGNADILVPAGVILNDVIVIPWGTQRTPPGLGGGGA